MPRIRCHYIDCVLIDEGYCSAAAIEVEPDTGCMTYKRDNDLAVDDDWEEEEEEEELEEWDENEEEDDDDDLWDEDDY